MSEEARGSSREYQLETRHLAAIILGVALLCVFSFMLGRWVERQAHRATAEERIQEGAGSDLSVEDVNRELTYYRTLDGTASAPSVEPAPPDPSPPPVLVERPASAASAAAGPGDGPAPPAGPGLMIQVLATRDAASAEALRDRLARRGYRASIAAGSGPSEAGLRRVRVGPYATRAEAERAARRLEGEEKVRTWIH